MAVILGIIIIKKPYNNYIKPISRFYSFCDEIKDVFKNNLFSTKKLITVAFINGMILFLAIFRIFIIAKGINIDDISFMSLAKAVLFTIFVSHISFVPGAYVVREASLVYFLSIEGVPYAFGTIIALFDRFFQTLIVFILGPISVLVLKKYYLIAQLVPKSD